MAVSAQGCRVAVAASTTLGCWGEVCCKWPRDALNFLVGSVLRNILDIENDVYRGKAAFACTLVVGDPTLGPEEDFILGLAVGEDDVRLIGRNDIGPVVLVEVVIW